MNDYAVNPVPLVDLAYLGFGEGLEQDAYGVRKLAATVDNLFIAVSCSKNFGVYRDRVGLVIALGKNAAEADAIISQLGGASRANVSMPPNHGQIYPPVPLTAVVRF